jgi:AcrR family transcriptional regulator
MGRDDVARHQRTRLYGAMIESVSRRGYSDTTVADVIALAGVSRRAFYEQFSNKEDCFLGTYDIVVARARKHVVDAWQRERGWSNRLHAACHAFLEHIARSPKGPRLVVVDALGIGPQARERMQLAGFAFERLLTGIFELAPDGAEVPPLAARAIVGGIRHLAFMRMLDGREAELSELTDEVIDWIEAYRSPASVWLGSASLVGVSREPPTPALFLCAGDQRARALGSVVHLTLDEGYANLTDPQIAQFAGISTEGFHKQFPNKEACFLAVLDEFVGEALQWVGQAIEESHTWPESVYRAVGAFVGYLLTHQALLRIAFIDVFEVGPAMVGSMTKSIEGLTDRLIAEAPSPRRGSTVAPEAITGAVWAIISSYVANNRLSRLPGMVDQITFVVLAPYIGPKDAAEAVRVARMPDSRAG